MADDEWGGGGEGVILLGVNLTEPRGVSVWVIINPVMIRSSSLVTLFNVIKIAYLFNVVIKKTINHRPCL